MNPSPLSIKKRLLILLVNLLLLLVACRPVAPTSSPSDASSEPAIPSEEARPTQIASKPNSSKSIWTVLIYLCGTDLESEGASASASIKEILRANQRDELRILIQTGGTREWQHPGINPAKLQRFEVLEDSLRLVQEEDLASMGKAETLGNFLRWGAQTYPADKFALILWDHGSGNAGGIGSDELFNDDVLELTELSEALGMAPVHFELIGFDACLMASLETAAAIAPFARYMIASEEVEPSTSWDYVKVFNHLSTNPQSDGAAWGRVIADSYYAKCAEGEMQQIVTLSLSDLSKIPQLMRAFDDYARELVAKSDNASAMQAYFRATRATEGYGGSNDSEGFANMVDLGHLARLTRELMPQSAKSILTALEETRIYQITGVLHGESSGLSVFVPIRTDQALLDAYAKVAVSGHYLRFLAGTNNWQISPDLNVRVLSLDDQGRVAVDSKPLIDYTQADVLNSADFSPEFQTALVEGKFQLQFTRDYQTIANLRYNLFRLENERQELLAYGSDFDVEGDEALGLFRSNLRGLWPEVNGLPLPLLPISFSDEFILYSVPVLLNDKEGSLRLVYTLKDQSYRILGFWDGMAANGTSGRDLRTLRIGDRVELIFSATTLADGRTHRVTRGSFTVLGDLQLREAPLTDGSYFYRFEVLDIFGRSYNSVMAPISVRDGRAVFDGE